jgi:hypothetical protein
MIAGVGGGKSAVDEVVVGLFQKKFISTFGLRVDVHDENAVHGWFACFAMAGSGSSRSLRERCS